MRSTGIVLLAIALGIPPAVTAQAQLEFAPYRGSYRPTSIIGIGDGSFPSGGSVRDTVGRLNSTTRGIRVTKWGRGRLGFEARSGTPRVPCGAASRTLHRYTTPMCCQLGAAA